MVRWLRDYLYRPVRDYVFLPLRDYFNRKIQSEVFSVILTIYITALGILGGRITDNITHSWPWMGIKFEIYRQTKEGIFINGVGEYYIAVLFFMMLFFLREKSKLHSQQELLTTIRTMPPAKIMSIFEKSYKGLRKYIADNVTEPDEGITLEERIENVDNSIRLGLEVVNIIAANFQRVDTARYAANLMLYQNTEDMDSSLQKEILGLMGEYVHPPTFDGLRGALILIPAYSASTDANEHSLEPDAHLKEFALPIPMEPYSKFGRKKRYLPGAPAALIEDSPALINDTHSLIAQYKTLNEYDVLPGVFENIDTYFRTTEAGEKIRSFLSVPLKYRHSGGREESVGVVSIHSDEKGLFASNELAINYICLCQPIFDQIAEMVMMRYHLQSLVSTDSPDDGSGEQT